MKLRGISAATLLAVLLAACASQQLPKGYESLTAEANLVAVSQWYQGVRSAYVKARQDGLMSGDQFVLAVKADQTATAAWNIYLQAVSAKTNTAQMWTVAINGLGVLEGLVRAWLPANLLAKKPALLGGS